MKKFHLKKLISIYIYIYLFMVLLVSITMCTDTLDQNTSTEPVDNNVTVYSINNLASLTLTDSDGTTFAQLLSIYNNPTMNSVTTWYYYNDQVTNVPPVVNQTSNNNSDSGVSLILLDGKYLEDFYTASALIGEDGGSIEIEGIAVVNFPQGALKSTEWITLNMYSNNELDKAYGVEVPVKEGETTHAVFCNKIRLTYNMILCSEKEIQLEKECEVNLYSTIGEIEEEVPIEYFQLMKMDWIGGEIPKFFPSGQVISGIFIKEEGFAVKFMKDRINNQVEYAEAEAVSVQIGAPLISLNYNDTTVSPCPDGTNRTKGWSGITPGIMFFQLNLSNVWVEYYLENIDIQLGGPSDGEQFSSGINFSSEWYNDQPSKYDGKTIYETAFVVQGTKIRGEWKASMAVYRGSIFLEFLEDVVVKPDPLGNPSFYYWDDPAYCN